MTRSDIPARPLPLRRAGTGLATLGLALGAAAGPANPPAPAAATPAAAHAMPTAASSGKGLAWLESYDDALSRAKKERKLVLLDFYTDWCGWCKRLDKDVFGQTSFQAAADGVYGVRINAERRPDLAQRYGVSSYPRLFFLNSDGVTVEQIRGYLDLGEFTNRVQAIKRGDTEFARLRDAAMDPSNIGAIYRFARFLSEDRQHEMAIQYWQQVHDLALQQLFQNPNAQSSEAMHREALLELANGYSAVGLDDVARQHFDEVVRVYTDVPVAAAQALVGLARLEAKSPAGKAKAIALAERVLKDYAGTPATRDAQQLLMTLRNPAPAKVPQ